MPRAQMPVITQALEGVCVELTRVCEAWEALAVDLAEVKSGPGPRRHHIAPRLHDRPPLPLPYVVTSDRSMARQPDTPVEARAVTYARHGDWGRLIVQAVRAGHRTVDALWAEAQRWGYSRSRDCFSSRVHGLSIGPAPRLVRVARGVYGLKEGGTDA